MDICIKLLNKSKVYGVEFRLFRNIENQIHIHQGSYKELEKCYIPNSKNHGILGKNIHVNSRMYHFHNYFRYKVRQV